MTSTILLLTTLLPLLAARSGASRPNGRPQLDPPSSPSTLSVRGLAEWDRLKIRLQPAAGSPAVGEIPPNASGVKPTGRKRRAAHALWREVEYQGVRGWVHGRFVEREARSAPPVRRNAPVAAAVVATAPARAGASAGERVFHEDLVCVGAAPAWKLIVDRDGSAAGNDVLQPGGLEDVHATPARAQKEKGHPRAWAITLADSQGIGALTLSLRRTDRCQVLGTNDRYVYEASAYQPSGRVLAGCCNSLQRAPVIIVKEAAKRTERDGTTRRSEPTGPARRTSGPILP